MEVLLIKYFIFKNEIFLIKFKIMDCNTCNKTFTSNSLYFIHKREKHTHNLTDEILCVGCNKSFHSVIFNKKKNIRFNKCEECRDLQRKLKTNHIINNTYIYGINNERYYIDNGVEIKACSLYNCNELHPCQFHNDKKIIKCLNNKCNNCYIENSFNYCDPCRTNNIKNKNILRNKIKELKIKLGGKCVECGFNKLFLLEFDHIIKEHKTFQITRSAPKNWETDMNNIQLLCGRCHRIKTSVTYYDKITNINSRSYKCKTDKKNLVKFIKQKIGKCQICEWVYHDKNNMCSALDFDHIIGEKYKKIADLYVCNKERIIEEILKTRLICRHCHELYTCLQKGGRVLGMYYTDDEILTFKNLLFDKNLMLKHSNEIKLICDELIN